MTGSENEDSELLGLSSTLSPIGRGTWIVATRIMSSGVLSPKLHFPSRTVEMWLPEGVNGRV